VSSLRRRGTPIEKIIVVLENSFQTDLLANNNIICSRATRQILGNCYLGEQIGKLIANGSWTSFARLGKKGVLAYSSANSSRAVHEQCSPGRQKRSFVEQFGELSAKCSWTIFARVGKKVIWRLIRRTVRELFMNNVRHVGQIGVLANNSANCSRTVHEQCSSNRIRRSRNTGKLRYRTVQYLYLRTVPYRTVRYHTVANLICSSGFFARANHLF
jgi:hypothetical protein